MNKPSSHSPSRPHADHDHDHDHDHGHDHSAHDHAPAAPAEAGAGFALAIGLNSFFVVVEFVYGLLAHSTALMADAGHNLSDVLGLALSWAAVALARRAPSQRYTYGLRNTSIWAALLNALLLLLACGGIAWEAIQRLGAPPEVASNTVMAVAGIGILVNGFSAWLFQHGHAHDLNRRGAYLHMLYDALVSLGVVLAGLVMKYTGWYWLDPVGSLVILAVIVIGTWGLLRDASRLALNSVPAHVDPGAVQDFLLGQPGVSGVHDLHIWALSTTETALTAHLVMPGGYPGDEPMDAIGAALRQQFSIQHSVLQMELGTTQHNCCLTERPGLDLSHAHHHAH
ncbi:MAG: cation transporter [Curvibacter sp.]|nr:cation transporter [Curvibacter sp.]